MGSRNPDRVPLSARRSRAETVQQMHAEGWDVIAKCDYCRMMLRVDLRVIAKTRGPTFSLWNAKARCKVVGCTGWVTFMAHAPGLNGHQPLTAPWPEGVPPRGGRAG